MRWMHMAFEVQEFCNWVAERYCDMRESFYEDQKKEYVYHKGDEVMVRIKYCLFVMYVQLYLFCFVLGSY